MRDSGAFQTAGEIDDKAPSTRRSSPEAIEPYEMRRQPNRLGDDVLRVRYIVMSASCPTSEELHSASSTRTPLKPTSTALRTVDNTQISVFAPVMTTVSTPFSISRLARLDC
jgi:hypothetical protein